MFLFAKIMKYWKYSHKMISHAPNLLQWVNDNLFPLGQFKWQIDGVQYISWMKR